MYVMQSLPIHQQSLAGGIFNMLIRLGSTVAIGISTAVYSSVGEAQADGGDPVVPYRMAFFVSVGLAGLSCLFLPFMRIGTQGNTPADAVAAEEMTASMGLVNPNATGETGDEKAEKRPVASGSVTEKE
jgi:hypothetical protein